MAHKLNDNSVFKNMLTLLWGAVAAKLLGASVMPILTRLYTPEDFGIMSVFIAVTFIIYPIFTLRYPLGIPACKTSGAARNLVVLSIFLSVFVFFALLIVYFILNFIGIVDIYYSSHKKYIYYYLIASFFLAINEIIIMWGTRERRFKNISIGEGLQALVGVALKIISGIFGADGRALMIGQAFQKSFGATILIIDLSKDVLSGISQIKRQRILLLARLNVDYPVYRLPSHFLMSFSMQAPVIFVAGLYGTKAVGQMGLAMMALTTPVTIIGNSLGRSYYAEIGKLKKNREKVRKITAEVIKKLFLISLIPAIIIFLFGDTIFSFVFGYQWAEAGSIAGLMSIYMVGQIISNPIMNVFNVFGGQKIYLMINITRLLIVLFIFNFVARENSLYFTIAIYSLSMFIFYLNVVFLTFYTIKDKGSK